jgi:DNA-binding MarR family transcriptional regulator
MTSSTARTELASGIADDLRTVLATLQHLNVPTWLELDLSMAQFKALVTVQRHPGVSVCQVARQLSIGESAASLMTDQLVRRGHVERATDPDDRRRVRLSASEHGQQQLDELRQGSSTTIGSWLADLADDDLEALARGLRALAAAVSDAAAGGPSPLDERQGVTA